MTNKVNLNISELYACLEPSKWDLGNQVLYQLCELNFTHDNEEATLAKIWLIGRAYAAAIERRKNKKEANDDFYIKKVAPAFKQSKLDEIFSNLKTTIAFGGDSFLEGLYAHGFLTTLMKELTYMNKRSLSSKYLHFHFPQVFFIYDSRAVDAIRGLVKEVPVKYKNNYHKVMDKDYVAFANKCHFLQEQISNRYGIWLNPRQLDNYLMQLAKSTTNNGSILDESQ